MHSQNFLSIYDLIVTYVLYIPLYEVTLIKSIKVGNLNSLMRSLVNIKAPFNILTIIIFSFGFYLRIGI